MAKKVIASDSLGIDVILDDTLRLDKALYSESQGRIIVTVAPENKEAFETAMDSVEHVQQIGVVTDNPALNINGQVAASITDLSNAYKQTLGGY